MTAPPEKIRCDACPVMCYIAPGQTGACDRYANDAGRIVRTDPVLMLSQALAQGHRELIRQRSGRGQHRRRWLGRKWQGTCRQQSAANGASL